MPDVQQIRRALRTYFLDVDLVRDLGTGTAFPASADIPDGLQAGDRLFRTDLLWPCIYDGTRWLSPEMSALVANAQNFSATGNTALHALRSDYAPYLTRIVLKTRVNTTNDATNNWTVVVQSLTLALATTAVYTLASTNGDGTSYTNHDGAPSTAAPSSPAFLRLALTKNVAPGTLDVAASVWYRLIVP
jgi:hypothetical protein